MRFSLVAILILLSTTGCLDTDGEIQGESTNGSTSTAAGEITGGVLPVDVIIGAISQLPSPVNGTGCGASEILEWTGTQWDCIPTPTVAGGAATSVPVSGIGPGTIPVGVLLPSNQITGALNPLTQLNGSLCANGEILESDGTSFTCVTPSTVATSVPASGVTAGALGAGVLIPSTQITGSINPTIQIGVGALNPGVTLATSQLSGTINPATQIGAGNIPTGVNLSAVSQLPAPLNGTGCAVGEMLQRTAGGWACIAIPSGADNLGNHTATQNLNLDNFRIANIHTGNASDPAIQFNGDADTGIFRPAANELGLTTGGVERLRVDASGDVGIGTTAPSTTLDVESVKNYVGTAPSPSSYDFNVGAVGSGYVGIGRHDGQPAIQGYGTGTSYNLILNPAAGNVGIGTTSPNSKLHIVGTDSDNTFIRIQDEPNDNNDWFELRRSNSSSTIYSRTGQINITTRNSDDVIINTGSSLHTVFKDNGRVGIGEATPGSRLQVAGAIQIANDTDPCVALKAGAIRYNGGVVEYCDATSWTAFGTAAGGEVNTASNIGVAGVGLFDGKSGVQLQFKNLNEASNKLVITDDVLNNEVDIDVVEGNIVHDNLSGFVSNEHVDHGTVSITAGTGLTGGGNITASRTLNVNVGTGPNQIVQLDGTSMLPAVDGSQLTNLPAAPVTSVFGRAGIVSAQNGDYTGSQVTNIPAGSIAAATTQAAINELDTEKLNTTGGVLSGNLAMGTNLITGLGTPLAGTDAATKAYVDTQVGAVAGDNLGNHTATANIQLDSNYLSGDGGNEGIAIDSDGNVGIGTTTPNVKLENSGRYFSGDWSSSHEVKFPAYAFSRPDIEIAKENLTNEDVRISLINDGDERYTSTGFTNDLGTELFIINNGSNRIGTHFGVPRGSSSGVFNYGDAADLLVEPLMLGSLRSDPVILGTNNIERVRITEGGNVGIGIANPTWPLDISHPTGGFLALRDGDAVLDSPGHHSALRLYDGSDQITGIIGFSTATESMVISNANDDGGLVFRSGGNTGAETRMVIDPSGNVGIGTPSPETHLQVQSSTATAISRVSGRASGLAARMDVDGPADGYSILNLFTENAATPRAWQFMTNNITNNTIPGLEEDLRIRFTDPVTPGNIRNVATFTKEGNVGVGTNTPEKVLHLSTNVAASADIQLDSFAGATPFFFMTRANGTSTAPTIISDGNIVGGFAAKAYNGTAYHTVGDLRFISTGTQTASSMPTSLTFRTTGVGSILGSERMRVDHNGNVGIGTPNPSSKLDISGNGTEDSTILRVTNLHDDDSVTSTSGAALILTAPEAKAAQVVFDTSGGNVWAAGVDRSGAVTDESFVINRGPIGMLSTVPNLIINPSGNMGIGTAVPAVELDVGTGVINASAICDESNANCIDLSVGASAASIRSVAVNPAAGNVAGDIVYNTTDGVTYFYTGTVWSPMASSGGSNSVVSNANPAVNLPGASAGDIAYNSTSNQLEYYNGSSWGAVSSGGAGDDLGNHTATSNVILGSNYLSGDGGNEGIAVDSDGNVGIGTAAPGAKLHVEQGGITVVGDSSSAHAAELRLIRGSATAGIGNLGQITFLDQAATVGSPYIRGIDRTVGDDSSDADIALYTNNTERLTIDGTSGNVGIGEAAPSSKLHVAGDIRTETTADTIYTNNLAIVSSSADMDINYSSADLAIHSDLNDTMTLLRNGNIGIGITSPENLLHIVGTNNVSSEGVQAEVRNLSSGANAWAGYTLANDIGEVGHLWTGSSTYTDARFRSRTILNSNINDGEGVDLVAHGVSSDIRLYTGGNGASNERVRIDSSGNVGIRTTNPQATLDVNGSIGVRGNSILSYNNTDTVFLRSKNGTSADGAGINLYTNDHATLSKNMALLADAVYVSGDLGVGTNSPAVELDVDTGTINAAAICDESNANCIDLSVGITGSEIAGTTITSTNLANNAVTSAKLNSNSVNSSKISNGSIQNVDIQNNTIVATEKLTSACTNGQILKADASGDFSCASDNTGSSVWAVNSGEASYVAGNVGVGITNPATALHVVSSDVANEDALTLVTNAVNADIFMQDAGSIAAGDSLMLVMDVDNDSNTNNIIFGKDVRGTGTTELMRIQENGRVGIGTTSPVAALHVESDGGISIHARGYADASGTGAPYYISQKARGSQASPAAIQDGDTLAGYEMGGYDGSAFSGAQVSLKGKAEEDWNGSAQGASFTVETTAPGQTTRTQKMVVTGDGDVGIGLTTPRAKLSIDSDVGVGLHISDDGSNDGLFIITPDGNEVAFGGGVSFTESAAAIGTYTARASEAGIFRFENGGFHFYGDNGLTSGSDYTPTENMRLTTTGDLGIGVISPAYQLEISGDAGKPGGGSWTNSSDARLKDVHGVYEKGLDEILQLEPVVFNYKKDNERNLASEPVYQGFVAQKVAEVFEEAVTEGKDGFLDFNMHSINVAVINAVKSLYGMTKELFSVTAKNTSELIKLKEENLKLKLKNKNLEDRMLRLEEMVLSKESLVSK